MTLAPSTLPRFVVRGSAATYGSRDEITGSRTAELGRAYTKAGAEVIARQWDLSDGDLLINIIDLAPRSEWSADIAAERNADAFTAFAERCLLPF